MADIKPFERDTLRPRLEALFPDMSQQMCEDLLPLIAGNLDHIEAARKIDRELNIEHREWMICIGRGFELSAHAEYCTDHRSIQPQPGRSDS